MPPPDLVSEERLRASFRAHAVTAQLYGLANVSPVAEAIWGRQIVACGIAPQSEDQWSFTARLGEGDGPFDTLRPAGTVAGLATFEGAGPPKITQLRADAEPSAPGSTDDAAVRGLVHYFFSLVEDPARDPLPFHPLLAETFSLELVDPPMATLDSVDMWVRKRLASVVASEHDLREIGIERDGDCGARVRIVMKSQALFPDGSGAISRNTQRWSVRDRTGRRFPVIEHVAIERDGVTFFGPAPDYAPREIPSL